jgi:phage shock protein PspC (stress-responsive transcriptional regulator)
MERIAITARLNRSTLQFDEAAYARLEAYLAEASGLLEGDPDPQEILADLEQAVADHCTRRLPPDRKVVTLAELEPALDAIGTVQVPGAAPSAQERPAAATSRPLQQYSEGAVISGVCLGLARYFGLNATALRVFAVLLLLLSGGGVIVVYLALMLLMPYAPLQGDASKLGWLPAKCRTFTEFVRAKLNLATT